MVCIHRDITTTPYGRSRHSLTKQIYGMYTQRHYNNSIWQVTTFTNQANIWYVYWVHTETLQLNNSIWQVTAFTYQANIWYVYTETLQLNNSIWQVTAFTYQANVWYVYTGTLQLNNSIWQVTAFTNQANIWYVYWVHTTQQLDMAGHDIH